MGAVLRDANSKWIDSGFKLTKEELIADIVNVGPTVGRL
jgi:hypothetical protein